MEKVKWFGLILILMLVMVVTGCNNEPHKSCYQKCDEKNLTFYKGDDGWTKCCQCINSVQQIVYLNPFDGDYESEYRCEEGL